MNNPRLNALLAFAVSCFLGACGGEAPESGSAPAMAESPGAEGAPAPVEARWRALIGEYAFEEDTLSILEEAGELRLLLWGEDPVTLQPAGAGAFLMGQEGDTARLVAGDGPGPSALEIQGRRYPRLNLGAEDGGTFRITPLRPVDELRAEALAASPPEEEGDFLPSDLVELVALDSTLHLDIRYASTNNFMGAVFYSEPRAFLQRPAAEAVVRASRWLQELGYGLLIHDGYRPWYVTKMFWDATPEELRVFVADPASGSRHNRGCAVDLTLYDLETGEPVVMTGGYDEMSPRSYPDYPGGTSRQRWHRELLRQAMEAQGFTVYDAEWWHFDYQDWPSYRIGNQRFEEISG